MATCSIMIDGMNKTQKTRISINLKTKFKILLFEKMSNKALININKSDMLKMYDTLLNISEVVIERLEKIKIVTAFNDELSILKSFFASKINVERTVKIISDIRIRP